MKTRPRLFLLSLTFLFAVQTPAQQSPPPTPQRDPAAVAALSKSLAATTGGQPISDVTLQGTARRIAGSDDETGTAVLKAIAAGASRLDLSFPSGSQSEVRANSADGRAGVWSGADDVKQPIAWHNLWTDSCWFFPASTLTALSDPNRYSLAYLGQERRNGQSVVHLSASQVVSTRSTKSSALIQRLSQMEIFLDSTSLLPVALSFSVHPDGDAGLDIPVEIRFSDYRLVGGVQVPFRVQRFLNNGLVLELQFQTVAVNTGLAASAFTIQ